MSATVVTSAVTVTADQTVVVITTTIAASGQENTGSAFNSSAGNGNGLSVPTSAPTVSDSGANNGSETNRNSLVPALVGGVLGGLALIALLILMACLMKRRRRARSRPSPFEDEANEKSPQIMAGLPPKPSSSSTNHTDFSHRLNPGSLSALYLLAAGRSVPHAESSYSHSKGPSTGSLPSSAHTYGQSPSQYHATSNRYSYVSGQSSNPSMFESPDAWQTHGHEASRIPSYDPYWSPSNAVPVSPPYTNARARAPPLPMGAAPPNYPTAHDTARNEISGPVGHAQIQNSGRYDNRVSMGSGALPQSNYVSLPPHMQAAYGSASRLPNTTGMGRMPSVSSISGSASERTNAELSHAGEGNAPRPPTIAASIPPGLQQSRLNPADNTRLSSTEIARRQVLPRLASSDSSKEDYWIKANKDEA